MQNIEEFLKALRALSDLQGDEEMVDREIDGLKFVRTCFACPEQYDVYKGEEQVAYVRLRHGHLTVDVPDAGGDCILDANPKGDGIFDNDERESYLQEIANKIHDHLKTGE